MSLRIDQALARAAELRPVSDSPELDLQLLLCEVLDRPRSYLYTWPERELSANQLERFDAMLRRRLQGEPVAHILGQREFWTLTLEVDNSTLIPRPETELLVELALERGADACLRVADLGTGTGAIALALATERPGWRLTAVEFNPDAVALAERNRLRLGLENVEVVAGSWCEPLIGHFDLILSNPPYIDPDDPHLEQGDVRFEPRSALVAQEQGLADIRQIAAQASALLQPGGWLMVEHGYDQAQAVQKLMAERGYRQVETRRDLAGNDRVTLAQWPQSGNRDDG